MNSLAPEDLPLLTAMLATTYPESFKEAVASTDRYEWIKAMTLEMDSLVAKNVFTLVPLSKGKKAIGCRWAYRTKRKVDGSIDKHKARLVVKGYLQRKGIEYHETYAPLTRQETIRFVLSHMAKEAWESQQMDVMTAFLNSLLYEEVYIKQPEGFEDSLHPDWVWRVKASLYGLKQAPSDCNVVLTKELVSYGVVQSKADPVLFTYRRDSKIIGAVVVHVDDIILTGTKSFMDEISPRLRGCFKMSRVGPVDTYLSLKVERGKAGDIFLSQQHYIQHIIDSHLPCNA